MVLRFTVSCWCDLLTRPSFYLDVLSAGGTHHLSRQIFSCGDKGTLTPSQASVLPLPEVPARARGGGGTLSS